MAKKGNGKKVKSEGRTPRLAPFVDSPFKIYATYKGKEHEAQVLSSGMIKFREKEYFSPSAAGCAILGGDLQVDGWKFWKFNKDGERVELNVLRGKESPLKVTEAKPKKEKIAKPKAEKKATAKKATVKKPRKLIVKSASPKAQAGESQPDEAPAQTEEQGAENSVPF